MPARYPSSRSRPKCTPWRTPLAPFGRAWTTSPLDRNPGVLVRMRVLLCGIALSALASCASPGERIGVSMALFDDNFLTVLRQGMQDHAQTLDRVRLQVEDAQNDVGRQLSQIQNFIAQGVDAIIVNPVDTDATPAMTRLAAEAGIPIIYVNREPADLDSLPP